MTSKRFAVWSTGEGLLGKRTLYNVEASTPKAAASAWARRYDENADDPRIVAGAEVHVYVREEGSDITQRFVVRGHLEPYYVADAV